MSPARELIVAAALLTGLLTLLALATIVTVRCSDPATDREPSFDPHDELAQWLRRCATNGMELPAALVFAIGDFLSSDPQGRTTYSRW